MTRPLRLLGSLAAALTLSAPILAQVHAPIQPDTIVVQNVVLSTADDAQGMDIHIRGGHVVELKPTGDELPPGARVLAGEGRLALPGFIDAWTTAGVEEPERETQLDIPIEVISDVRAGMREANRKGVRPSFRAADVIDFGADGAGAWRAEGFGTLLAAPDGALLAGHGALVATRAGARRDLVLNPEVFQFGAFTASGRGFPSTLMGYFSQLRQFFYDAERQTAWQSRYDAGQPVPRPAWDPDLAAGAMLLGGRELYIVEAHDAGTVERWLRLADEFDLRLAFAGGAGASEHAALLAERQIPVILSLELGDEPEDPSAEEESDDQAADEPEQDAADEEPVWHYTKPTAQLAEERRLWEERRDNAKLLTEAGVRVLYGSGDRKPKEFMADLRKAIDGGLDAATVTHAMTADAALFFGHAERLGALEAGRNATFSVWTGDPFGAEPGDIALTIVDGVVYEFEVRAEGEGPDEGVDASGTWEIEIEGMESEEATLMILEMDDEGRLTGTLRSVDPESGEVLETAVKGAVSGSSASLEGTLSLGDFEVDVRITGELNGDTVSGESTLLFPWGEEVEKYSGTRRPEGHQHESVIEHYSCMHGTEAL